MPYRYMTFDGVALPTHKPVDDLSSAQSESAIVQALNGSVDVLGAVQANSKPQIIEFVGMYKASEYNVTDPGLLITGDGFYLVTEAGDFIVESVTNTENFVDAWRRRRGVRSLLIRQRESDSVQSWAWARLLQFEMKRQVDDADSVARVRLAFEVAGNGWRKMTPTTVTGAVTTSTTVTVTNGCDLVIDDAEIEVEAVGGYIDDISIALGSDQELTYTANVPPYVYTPIASGEFISFDCGGFRLGYNGVYGNNSLYTFFDLGALHSRQNWIELQPGSNGLFFVMSYPGAASAIARVRYYEREA